MEIDSFFELSAAPEAVPNVFPAHGDVHLNAPQKD